MSQDDQSTDAPFSGGPFGGEGGDDEASSFLDDLRAEGEGAVSREIAGLQAAMERVDAFAESFAAADVDALKSEWHDIEAQLKRALQSGISAVEQARSTRAHPSVVADEVSALEAELARKNDLIAQLSDTVKTMSREADEKDRRAREDLRAAKDRAAELEEDLGPARTRATALEADVERTKTALDVAVSERDEARRQAADLQESLDSERTLQEERRGRLEAELEQERQARSTLEGEKRTLERSVQDLEERLAAADKSRARLEQERSGQAQEASRAAKEARELKERLESVDSELAEVRERGDRKVSRLRRRESRLVADAEEFRSRVAAVLESLTTAAESLGQLPGELPPEESEDEPAGTDGSDAPRDQTPTPE